MRNGLPERVCSLDYRSSALGVENLAIFQKITCPGSDMAIVCDNLVAKSLHSQTLGKCRPFGARRRREHAVIVQSPLQVSNSTLPATMVIIWRLAQSQPILSATVRPCFTFK
jgi:hypothetical protein